MESRAGGSSALPVQAAVVTGYEARAARRARDSGPLVRHQRLVLLAACAFGAAAFALYPFGAKAAIAALLAGVLVTVTATDLERRIIPNRVVLPGLAVILIGRVTFFSGQAPEFVLAAVGAGLAFLLPSLIDSRMMGMGDVKLVALLGAGLGRGVIGAIIVAFLTSLPIAVAVLVKGGVGARATLPFGPFLALGGLFMLIGPRLFGA